MTRDQALRILSEISPEEARRMDDKIRKAEKKITFRQTNPGRGYGRPQAIWNHRNPHTNK